MKKHFFLLLMVCSLPLMLHAQRQNTYFLKKSGDYVTNLDSAETIRIVQEPERGSKLYLTKEFYKNGNRRSVGYSSFIDPPKYEGYVMLYHLNGNKKQIMKYKAGKLVDTVFGYFPNGKPHIQISYQQLPDGQEFYIHSVQDSLGNSQVTNGTGNAELYDADYEYITGKGAVKDGHLDGQWIGELHGTDTLKYIESYANGKMISGQSSDAKGNVYYYTKSEVQPSYPGGMNAFYQHNLRGIRYPEIAQRGHIQGVARVGFVVQRDGTLSNVRIINEVHPALAAEAMRVVMLSKKWLPGVMKGRPVNVSYVVPISFALSN